MIWRGLGLEILWRTTSKSIFLRLYDGRIARGPLRGTSVYLKVYPGRRAAAIEADMMAANELEAHAFLQEIPRGGCQNPRILLGGFKTETGEQVYYPTIWLWH
ncbi:hypothetical protein Droror1_Dr00009460 [Drosera rotundifolia]